MPIMYVMVRVAPDDVEATLAAIRSAGYDARLDRGYPPQDSRVVVEAAALVTERGVEVQRQVIDRVEAALRGVSIDFTMAGNAVSIGGGTPYHRWLPITVDGEPTDTKILVVDDHEIEKRLTALAPDLGIGRERLDVVRPDPWPAI